MSKFKGQEQLEQAAHFLLLGVALAVIHPALAIGVYLIRELVIQWPPGDTVHLRLNAGPPPHYVGYDGEGKPYAPMDRVEDLRKDSFYTLGGAAVGSVIHSGLVWWLL
jgi:hypothetical protein